MPRRAWCGARDGAGRQVRPRGAVGDVKGRAQAEHARQAHAHDAPRLVVGAEAGILEDPAAPDPVLVPVIKITLFMTVLLL